MHWFHWLVLAMVSLVLALVSFVLALILMVLGVVSVVLALARMAMAVAPDKATAKGLRMAMDMAMRHGHEKVVTHHIVMG